MFNNRLPPLPQHPQGARRWVLRCCAATLPQLGLLLLCLAWLLPGLIGHAPWKGGDGEHFVRLWLLLQNGDAAANLPALPPLYYAVARATAWLTAPVLALPSGARLASGLFVALTLFFVARTARVLYDAETGWAATLTLLGCIGLLVRGHELNAATAQLAAAALTLYAIARLPQQPRSSLALAGGVILLLLAGGAAEAGVLLLLAGLLALWLEDYRTPTARCALAWGVLLSLLAAAIWLAMLAAQTTTLNIALARLLNVQRWQGAASLHVAYYPSILGWYAWPAWPLAAWALYRNRRQWRAPGVVLPTGVLLGLLTLYVFDAHPSEAQGLILLLPLALLGAHGLFSLRRGAAYALLWFSVMLFGFVAILFWLYWSAHDLGSPARLAARLSKFGVTHVGELRPWTLLLGATVSVVWVTTLLRLQRSPLRPMLVWTGSLTFVWVLLLALFQTPLDRRLSYASVGEVLAARVPASECLQTYRVRSQQRWLLEYHSERRFAPADPACNWLLVETRRREPPPQIPPGWIKQWEGARPGDRSDRFHLYARP